jgi:TonB family protein
MFKKLLYLIILLTCTCKLSFAQQANDSNSTRLEGITEAKFCPDLNSVLLKNIKYPESAKRMNVQGTVFVRIDIDSTGKITETKIVKGVMVAIDDEALRVVYMLKVCKPRLENGHPVNASLKIAVRFELDR